MSKSAMVILAELGKIRKGMYIELVDAVRQTGPARSARALFRARVEKPQGGRESVRWQRDRALYSPSSLLDLLEKEFNVQGLWGVYRNWRIRGHVDSLHDEANR